MIQGPYDQRKAFLISVIACANGIRSCSMRSRHWALLWTPQQALTSSVLIGHNSRQEQPYYVYSCSTFTGATGR